MFRVIWILSVYVRAFLRAWMPTNVVLDLIRSRRGLKWGVPAMGLAVPYFAIAYWCTAILASHGSGWVNLIVVWAIWNGLKFLWMGPVSLVLLVRVRIHEATARRRTERAATTDGPDTDQDTESRGVADDRARTAA